MSEESGIYQTIKVTEDYGIYEPKYRTVILNLHYNGMVSWEDYAE